MTDQSPRPTDRDLTDLQKRLRQQNTPKDSNGMLPAETLSLTCHACKREFAFDRPAVLDSWFVRILPGPQQCGQCGVPSKPRDLATEQAEAARARWDTISPKEFLLFKWDLAPCKDASRKALAWQYSSKGLILHGPTRQGKTRTAWMVIKGQYLKGANIHTFGVGDFGESMALAYHRHEQAEWLTRMVNMDLILLDDLGNGKITERVEEALFRLIDKRINKQRPTLITTQYDGPRLVAQFEPHRRDALLARLREFFDHVAFTQDKG